MATQIADLFVRFGADTTEVDRAFDSVGSSVERSRAGLGAATAGLTAFGGGIAAGLGGAVNAATGFEDQMYALQAVSGVTGAEFDALSGLALQIGQDTTFSASEAAAALGELAKAGVSVEDIMGGAATGATDLAAAAGTSVPDAATLMANALNVFGLGGDDATKVADVFAAAANKSAADVGDLGYAMQSAGNVAAQAGYGLEETVGALALFADYGLKGSDAGTSLRSALLNMMNPIGQGKEAMAEYGVQVRNADGSMKSMQEMAAELQSRLGGLSAAERDQALAAMFGSDAVRVGSILFRAGAAEVGTYTTAVNDAGAANEMAATRLQGFGGAMEGLRGSIETAAIVLGQQLTPYLQTAAGFLTGLVNGFLGLPQPVQQAIAVGAALTAGLALLAGGLGALALALPVITAGFGVMGAAVAVATGPIGLIAAALAGLIALGIAAYANNWLGFGDAVRAVGAWLGEAARGIQAAAIPALQALGGGVTTVLGIIGQFVAILREQGLGAAVGFAAQQIGTVLVGALDGLRAFWAGTVWPWLAGLPESIRGIFAGAAGWLIEAGRGIVQGLWDGATAVWGSVATWFGGRPEVVRGLIGGGLDWLRQAGMDLLQGLWNGATEIWNRLAGWIGGLPQTIKNYFANAATWLWSAGWDILVGLYNGMIAGAEEYIDKAVSFIVDKIPGPIRDAMGIASPSTVMMGIGRSISEGLALGVGQGAPLVDRAMGDLRGRLAAGAGARRAAVAGGGGAREWAPRMAGGAGGSSAGNRTTNVGGVTVNVSGAGSPNAVADQVVARIERTIRRLQAAS